MTLTEININEMLLEESIFKVGSVYSVEGRKVTIKVNKDKNLSHLSFKGQIIKKKSMGCIIYYININQVLINHYFFKA